MNAKQPKIGETNMITTTFFKTSSLNPSNSLLNKIENVIRRKFVNFLFNFDNFMH